MCKGATHDYEALRVVCFIAVTIKHVLASLVRLASDYHLQPSRTMASGMAPRRRTEMDLGITSGLGPRWVYRRVSDQQER